MRCTSCSNSGHENVAKIRIENGLLGVGALADSYRVHYSIRGSGQDITVQAESSAEARRVVMDMFGENCVVQASTGSSKPAIDFDN